MSNADFYIGLGHEAKYLGSLEFDASPAEMDDMGLFGPATDGDFTEDTFREIVESCAEEPNAFHATWPWSYPDSSGTDLVFAFVRGSVHVFERGERDGQTGQFLVALHYPNGARKATAFPAQVKP